VCPMIITTETDMNKCLSLLSDLNIFKPLRKSCLLKMLVYLFVLFFPIQIFSGMPRWPVGEELTYKVKWSIFRLGTLRLKVNDTLHIDDKLVYHVQFFIDSNPLLFFVNHHSVYESYFSDRFHSHLFRFNEKIDGILYRAVYQFDYTDSLIFITLTDEKDTTHQIRKRVPLTESIYDGTALLYYLRSYAGQMKTDTLLFLSNDDIENAVVRFSRRKYSVKIGSLENSLSSFYLDGRIFEKTVAGLTGRFQAWIAADDQRPPLKARLKVFIGYITIELEEWNKWRPM
jgi:hypothetical protein